MAGNTHNFQSGILADVPGAARYLTFSVAHPKHVRAALVSLAAAADGDEVVVGVSSQLADQLGAMKRAAVELV